MTLIIRDELMEQCLSAGRVLERTVKEQLQNNPDPLTDEKLEEVFEPVVKFVEERTEVRVRKEIDDVEAMMKEEKENKKLERERALIRCEVENRVVLNINGKRETRIKDMEAKRVKKAIVKEQLLPEFKTAVIEEFEAAEALSDLDNEDEVSRHYTWATHWDKYCPELNIKVDEPADLLVTGHFYYLGKYLCSKKQRNRFSIAEITELLEANKQTFSDPSNSIPEAIQLLKLTNELLQTDNITPNQLFVFMKELTSSGSNSREFIMEVMSYIYSCQKKSSKQELCSAYDCYEDLEDDESYEECEESDCEAKICINCLEQDRVLCAAHR